MISPVRNATSAQLDAVEDSLLQAVTLLLDRVPRGRHRKPRPAGDIIDQVAMEAALDRSVVQMALMGLVRAQKFKLTKHFEVTRVR